MIRAAELAALRRQLEGLELMRSILHRLELEQLGAQEDGRLEAAHRRASSGLEELRERARRELEVEELVRLEAGP